jgi:hypothetical protein
VAPTSYEAGLLLDMLRMDGGTRWRSLRDAVVADPEARWERDLFLALDESEPSARDALVMEQLQELDWRTQRWARVPRVCASIATSAGFLFGSLGLLRGLALPVEEGAGIATRAAMVSALDALAIGIAGTSFCIAVHVRTRRVVRERLALAERLVGRLQALAGGEAP